VSTVVHVDITNCIDYCNVVVLGALVMLCSIISTAVHLTSAHGFPRQCINLSWDGCTVYPQLSPN